MRAKMAVAALLATLVVGTRAESISNEALLVVYLADPTYKTYLADALLNAEPRKLSAECPTLTLTRATEYLILKPPIFEKRGNAFAMRSGTWISIAHMDRCGKDVRRRMMLNMEEDSGRTVTYPLLPGDFRGNVKLESDARQIVLLGLAGKGHCAAVAEVEVLDVINTKEPSAEGWTETWIADACGTVLKADVTYTSETGGMQITATVAAAS